MTEILFYHLTEQRPEQALPMLLERSLERGWKAVVECRSDQLRDALDESLWTYRDDSFLPHAADTGNPDGNPVWITTSSDNPIDANIRFFLENAEPSGIDEYDRVILMFDGHDEDSKSAAREHWKAFKGSDHDLTYWQQDGGRWVKKG